VIITFPDDLNLKMNLYIAIAAREAELHERQQTDPRWKEQKDALAEVRRQLMTGGNGAGQGS
jgi:hypothetical protein